MDTSARARCGIVVLCMVAANIVMLGYWLTDPTVSASKKLAIGLKDDTRKVNNVLMTSADQHKARINNGRVQEISAAPKVALMFLTLGSLPHEPSWRAFLEAAGRLQLAPEYGVTFVMEMQPEELVGKLKPRIEPYPYREDYFTYVLQDGGGFQRELLDGVRLQEEPTDERKLLKSEVERLLEGKENGRDIIRAQSLFSLYVNAPPDFEYPPNSLFHGSIVSNTVNTVDGYGLWVPVEAHLRMIQEALKDPRNEKFVLLSESCIPIHRPEIVYAQLIGDPRSVVRACPNASKQISRLHPAMLTEHFKKADWRKSSQWSALNRDHGLLVMEDQHVKEVFKRHCFRRKNPHPRMCIPDEHYIPSLLGSYQLHNQTTCTESTYSEWPNPTSAHPRTFQPSDVNAKLIRGFHRESCNPAGAHSTIHCLFKRKPGFENEWENSNANLTKCSPTEQIRPTWVTNSGYQLLPSCFLFARKFKKDSMRQVLEAVLACNGVGVGHWC